MFNGYYDNKGKRVQGVIKGKVRMELASCVFAIMSGVADAEQVKKIWIAVKKHLQDKASGGFRLNTNFGSSYLDLGRAYSFSYGDKENGAFFNHMVVMLAKALYCRGFIKEGAQALSSIYKMAVAPQAKIYPLIPEYFNNSGAGLYLYLTGSASWYIYTLVEEILGIQFILGDIVLTPKLMPLDFFKNNIKAKYPHAGKIINLSYININPFRKRKFSNKASEKSLKIKAVLLEGKRILKTNNKYIIKRGALARLPKKKLHLKVYLA